jgi:phosphomannomutase
MAEVNPAIFRAYDIRGTYGTDFDALFASRLARHLASYLGAHMLVMGRDGRSSGPELAHAVADGFMAAGIKVIDIGEVSSPQFYWAARMLGADGGIMVTASHNPDADNGFKAIARRETLLEVIGGHELRQVYDSHGGAHRPGGALERQDVIPGYAAAVAYAADWEGGTELALAMDAPSPVQRVLERLGPIAPDDGFLARFDADGDRVVFYDRGREVAADLIFILLAERQGFSPVVADTRFTRAAIERLGERGVPLVRSRVGRLSMTRAMQSAGAAFGAELSGHYYWRAFGGMECPELALLSVYRLVREAHLSLGELTEPYRRYFRSDELSFPLRDRKEMGHIFRMLEHRYAGCRFDRTDGLTVDCWDGHIAVPRDDGFWFNVRPSNTEPVLRCCPSAPSRSAPRVRAAPRGRRR